MNTNTKLDGMSLIHKRRQIFESWKIIGNIQDRKEFVRANMYSAGVELNLVGSQKFS